MRLTLTAMTGLTLLLGACAVPYRVVETPVIDGFTPQTVSLSETVRFDPNAPGALNSVERERLVGFVQGLNTSDARLIVATDNTQNERQRQALAQVLRPLSDAPIQFTTGAEPNRAVVTIEQMVAVPLACVDNDGLFSVGVASHCATQRDLARSVANQSALFGPTPKGPANAGVPARAAVRTLERAPQPATATTAAPSTN